jgi:hypothetical protein
MNKGVVAKSDLALMFASDPAQRRISRQATDTDLLERMPNRACHIGLERLARDHQLLVRNA